MGRPAGSPAALSMLVTCCGSPISVRKVTPSPAEVAAQRPARLALVKAIRHDIPALSRALVAATRNRQGASNITRGSGSALEGCQAIFAPAGPIQRIGTSANCSPARIAIAVRAIAPGDGKVELGGSDAIQQVGVSCHARLDTRSGMGSGEPAEDFRQQGFPQILLDAEAVLALRGPRLPITVAALVIQDRGAGVHRRASSRRHPVRARPRPDLRKTGTPAPVHPAS